MFSVTQQRFEIDILRESVMVGNDALFKCSIPSFVSDFVSVTGWVDSEGDMTSFGALGNLKMNLLDLRSYLSASPNDSFGKGFKYK